MHECTTPTLYYIFASHSLSFVFTLTHAIPICLSTFYRIPVYLFNISKLMERNSKLFWHRKPSIFEGPWSTLSVSHMICSPTVRPLACQCMHEMFSVTYKLQNKQFKISTRDTRKRYFPYTKTDSRQVSKTGFNRKPITNPIVLIFSSCLFIQACYSLKSWATL